jgi:protease-4
LGNIDDAIKSAAKKAGLKDYKLVAYPEQKSVLNKLGESFSADVKTRILQSELGENYKVYEQIKNVTSMMRTPLMRMEYDVVVK